jgi:hypothetical protein
MFPYACVRKDHWQWFRTHVGLPANQDDRTMHRDNSDLILFTIRFDFPISVVGLTRAPRTKKSVLLTCFLSNRLGIRNFPSRQSLGKLKYDSFDETHPYSVIVSPSIMYHLRAIPPRSPRARPTPCDHEDALW